MATEFRDFVDQKELPLSGTVLARVSDNVLEKKDWPVVSLSIEQGVVVEQISVKNGVYDTPQLKGYTMDQLAKWSCLDTTGNHPEQYYELKVILKN